MYKIEKYTIKELRINNLPQNKKLTEYARKNRKKGYISEVLFWKQVHKKKFHGIDFDRQFIIGNYIADFFARSLSLVVEIDGGSHNEHLEYDKQRDIYMQSLGIKVFRTTDYDVMNNLENVMHELEQFIILHYEHE
jgi:very-short-patch-repair endonuclease